MAVLFRFVLLFCLVFASLGSPAYAFDAPAFQGDVLDEAGVLDEADKAALLARIRILRESDGIWAAIYVARDLQGDTIENAAVKIFEKWKLGLAGKDNGLLIMIVPSARQMRIEVGYGLEGFITDVFSNRIINEQFKPAFREQRYTDGLLAGLERLSAAARGEMQAEGPPPDPVFAPPQDINWDGAWARFGLSLGANLMPILLYLLARYYGRIKGRVEQEKKNTGTGLGEIKTMFILFGFFGIFFGVFYAVFGAAFAEEPDILWVLMAVNGLFAGLFVLPFAFKASSYLSADAFRRQQARERLLRIKKRSRKARNIFGVWFDPAQVSVSGGGTKPEPRSSSSSSSSGSGSSSSSSSSSGGGRSGGGGASGSW